MNKASDPVLEFLDEHGIAVPIGVLDNELEVSYPTIHRTLPDLLDKGFIEKDEEYESFYRITDRGRGYLRGDVDASELEATDSDDSS